MTPEPDLHLVDDGETEHGRGSFVVCEGAVYQVKSEKDGQRYIASCTDFARRHARWVSVSELRCLSDEELRGMDRYCHSLIEHLKIVRGYLRQMLVG
jgi:hypothetical protein